MASALLSSSRKFNVQKNIQNQEKSRGNSSGRKPSYMKMRTQEALHEFKELQFFISEENELLFNCPQLAQFKESVRFSNPLTISIEILASASDIELVSRRNGNSKRLSVPKTLTYVESDLGVSCLGKEITHLFLVSRNGGFKGVLPKGTVCPNPLGCDFCMLQVCACYVLKVPFTDVFNVFHGILGHLNVSNGKCPKGTSVLTGNVSGYLEHFIKDGDLAKLTMLGKFNTNSENLALPSFQIRKREDLGFLKSFDFRSGNLHGDDQVKFEKPLNSRKVLIRVSKPKALTK